MEETKINVVSRWFGRIFVVGIILIYFSAIFFLQPIQVKGESMYPTLISQEYGLSFKINAVIKTIDRFDIVVVKSEKTEREKWVKRVIGLPNETIKFENEKLYINGKKINETYLDTGYFTNKREELGFFTEDFTVTLGEDEYFLMGDNRPYSHDSRDVGVFHKKDILAKDFIKLRGVIL